MNDYQIKARQHATDVLLENLPDDWSQQATITDDMVNEALHRINPSLSGSQRRRDRANMAASVRRWMSNQSKHDGYVDQLAVDRAVELRHDVWVVLTDVEKSTVVRVLAAMPNPWGVEGGDVFSADPGRKYRSDGLQGAGSLRAERFAQWPKADRIRLRDTVSARRSREAAAAVAA